MTAPTGVELLLLAADLSHEDARLEAAGSITEAHTVALEEIEYANSFRDNTFLEGISTIVSSTPIPRSSCLQSFSDPRQIPALDLSISMDETQHPLDLSMECDGAPLAAPLDLVMPKKDVSTKVSTGKPLNLCVVAPEQKSDVNTKSTRPDKSGENTATKNDSVPRKGSCTDSGTSTVPSQPKDYHGQDTTGSSIRSTDQKSNESVPSLPKRNRTENESVCGQLQTTEPTEHGVEIADQRPVLLQQLYNGDPDSDSGSETNENASVEALTEHAVSEYFEPYANQTLISTDESGESDSESENSSNSEQKVLAASSPSTSVSIVDSSLEDQQSTKHQKKRPAWVTRKKRRERGLKYQRTNGTFAPARCIKKPCQCTRLKCYLKYSDELRSSILQNLLNLTSSGQNQFICNHVTVKPTARTRVINPRRTATRVYYLPALNGKHRVCKNMFLSTLDIRDKKVRYLAMKTVAHGGICPDDMRAENRNPHVLTEHEINQIEQHIMSFPSNESHYSREKCAKKFLSSDLSVAKMYDLYKEQCTILQTHAAHYNTYRKVFRSLNLSFRKPRVDTCNTCDETQTRLRLATENDKPLIKEELEIHHQKAQFVYDKKRSDIETAKNMDDTCTISFDLQKALATPSLSCGEVYYLRQMYTYNLTIFVSSKSGNEALCYLWDESQARRGAQEVGSCLFKFLSGLPNNIKILNCYSDRCFGQNCNIIICSMFSAFITLCVEKKREMTITHNFMVSGHSHMECDSVHSSIERAKKKTSVAIEIPKDWATFIRSIRRKIPFKVIEMEITDFLALKDLDRIFKKPACDNNGDAIKIQKIMCFKYQTSLAGRVEFKYDPTNCTWSQFTFSRENISTVVMPNPINSEPISLPQAKLEDLRKQLKFIKNKAYYETFLKEIVPKKRGRKPVNHCPDDFDADLDKEFFEEEEINVTITCSESDPLA